MSTTWFRWIVKEVGKGYWEKIGVYLDEDGKTSDGVAYYSTEDWAAMGKIKINGGCLCADDLPS